ncbi:thiol reductant ABC exporter subunit CydC [Convivina intestini]|uniref:ATP-binding cassette subfamily C protein CydC n=1 Tax=Convivina intestini TaxID=1505726 RepID=A0A2U1DCE5_9LACO|nr:thiol reductant ABC exporter subunit CydC [Convivina intestini]PVY85348.1 ATP-binding cassette subfamily C protein CydC [Convivina intestini]CAH1852940.1 putative ABC transporter ATP-binding/permease protein [Convivina intestini]SDB86094.1 ATP-binding cassette, subfamily C, CydC [Leuconostocaceae bacterium R-53105]
MKELKKLLAQDHWVMPFLRQQKRGLWSSIVLGFMTTFAAAALMFISGYLISRSAQHPSNILLIYVPIVLTRGFGIARPVFRYVERLVSHNWVLRVVSKSRQRLYQSAAQSASSIRSRLQTGQVLGILAEDLEQLENLYLRTLFPLGAGMLLYLISSIGLGIFSWTFMLLWLLVLALILIVIPLASLTLNRAKVSRQKALQSALYTDATDAILGMQDWVLSGRQADLVAQEGKTMQKLSRVKGKLMAFGWWRDFTIQLLSLLLMVLIMIWATHQFGHNFLASNYIAAFTLAIIPLVDSFIAVNQGVSESSFYEDSIKRLNTLPEPSQNSTAGVKPQSTTVVFNQVSFAYGDKLVLNDLSFDLLAGQKMALLGPSGAGKTTILKLLAGDLQPTNGKVTLGGLNPNQLADELPKTMAVLDQQSYLFDTTIENNIRMGNLTASQVQVEQAVQQAGLADLVASLPQGYQTPMQEAGQRFSGGERQRFALARILLQDAPIVILDEPTVSLDPKTEAAVLTQIFTALKDRTIIWVTHHLTGIEAVDQIYFLNDGHFTMAGSPSELLAHSEAFKQLYAMDQF